MNSLRQKLLEQRKELLQFIQNDSTEVHAGLWLDKYLQSQERLITNERGEQVSPLSSLVEEVSLLPVPKAYKKYYQRWETVLKEQCNTPPRLAAVQGRMIVGLGDESVLETSIALHQTYGVPYIPGSALKGLAASYARQRLTKEWQKGSEAYKIVFGDTDNAGYITFFDALYKPDSGCEGHALYPDVITVHHQQYYQDGTVRPPTDRDKPIPISFLSATGQYLIALAAPNMEKGDEWLAKVFDILGNALQEMGIGAKTSSGYGRMLLEGFVITQQSIETEGTLLPKRDRQHVKLPSLGSELLQEARGIKDSTALRERFHLENAIALLRYRDYDPLDIVIAIGSDYPEAASWNDGNSHRCRVEQVDEREEGFVIFCKPAAKKNKAQDKKKKK